MPDIKVKWPHGGWIVWRNNRWVHDYETDIGNSHVIAWYLWQIIREPLRQIMSLPPNTPYKINSDLTIETFDPEDWSRYDGELL